MIRVGNIVDTTFIEVSSFTKNKDGKCDPAMSSGRKATLGIMGWASTLVLMQKSVLFSALSLLGITSTILHKHRNCYTVRKKPYMLCMSA